MTRDELINAIDSPTVQALARVFNMTPWRMDSSFSEQIVEVLAPKLTNAPAQRPPKPSAWRTCWVSLNTSRTQLFEIEAEANAKARETGGCVIPLYAAPAQCAPCPTEHASIIERITNITTWLREPDWTEEASLEWLMDWMNRRPIAELAMVAMLMPGPAVTSTQEAEAALAATAMMSDEEIKEASNPDNGSIGEHVACSVTSTDGGSK